MYSFTLAEHFQWHCWIDCAQTLIFSYAFIEILYVFFCVCVCQLVISIGHENFLWSQMAYS